MQNDYTSSGGIDFDFGAQNILVGSTPSRSATGYVTDPDTGAVAGFMPGCDATRFAANQCTYKDTWASPWGLGSRPRCSPLLAPRASRTPIQRIRPEPAGEQLTVRGDNLTPLQQYGWRGHCHSHTSGGSDRVHDHFVCQCQHDQDERFRPGLPVSPPTRGLSAQVAGNLVVYQQVRPHDRRHDLPSGRHTRSVLLYGRHGQSEIASSVVEQHWTQFLADYWHAELHQVLITRRNEAGTLPSTPAACAREPGHSDSVPSRTRLRHL
jgi:hypothetical protein